MLHKNLSAVMWFLFMPGCIAVCTYIAWTCAHGAVALLADNDDEDDSNDDESNLRRHTWKSIMGLARETKKRWWNHGRSTQPRFAVSGNFSQLCTRLPV